MKIENDLAVACRDRLAARIDELESAGFASEDNAKGSPFSSELYLYRRIIEFEFEKYPNYTAPWHLLTWPHMRWDHVYQVVQVMESLRQPTGSNVGAALTLQPFQVMIVLAILGPEDPENELRMVREGLLTLSRKNGKTLLVSAIATALMVIHPEDYGLMGQEIQIGASDREQAGIMYGMADRMVSMDEDIGISGKFHSVPSSKKMTHRSTMSTLKCLSSDAYRAHGGNPAVVLLDEIGNVPANAAEEFYSVLTTGFGAQNEPLTMLLSTQAPNDQHFFSLQVDRAKRVNEGMIEDPQFAGFVFAVPDQDAVGNEIDAFDENAWYLGNPGLGTIANWPDMRDWAKKAKELPSLKNKFENLKLNRRVSETSSFVTKSTWKSNVGYTIDPDDLVGRQCYMGLDLSETTDLTAKVLLFEDIGDGRMPVLAQFWIPGDDLRGRIHRDKVPYDVWVDQGLVDASSAKTIDYGKVAASIVEDMEKYDVQGIGFDRWRMKFLRAQLTELGFEWSAEDNFLIEIGQGFKDQSRTIEVLEGLLLNERCAHGGNPVLTWCAANTVVARDPAGSRKFEKTKSYGRIDGLVALGLAAHVRDTLGISEDGFTIFNDAAVEVFM